ncbi:MAG TPA: DivIVA domain-containing protein [Ignavibacteria bacterium]|nr:DivIVA domain-containing protein [Ignavibacteria bacterium]
MNLTSRDIKKNDFRKSLRGFDVNEVEAFLETVSNHYEKLLVENKNLMEKVKSLTNDINIYKENELTLQKAIVKSQDLAEEIVNNAKRKADLIVREAELNSKKIGQDVNEDIINKRHELEEIKNKNERLLEETKSFLTDKLNEFEDFMKNKKIFKMELAKMKSSQEHDEHNEHLDSLSILPEEPVRKASNDNENINDITFPSTSFDENFETR